MADSLVARACGAVIVEDRILMVRHVHDGQNYWTLPGGGIEPGESPEAAAKREVHEETGLVLDVVRFLFTSTSARGTVTHCYLMTSPRDADQASLGHDPEQLHLDPDDRLLQAIEWHSLQSKQDDLQVSRVIAALNMGRGA